DRHLEDHAQANDDGEKQVGVLADGDHRLELLRITDQEFQSRRKYDLVAEGAPADEKKYRENHERNNVLLFAPIEPRRDESPHLVEHERRRKEQSGNERRLDVKVEAVGGIQVNQFLF